MDTTQKPEGCPIELEKTPTSLKVCFPRTGITNRQIYDYVFEVIFCSIFFFIPDETNPMWPKVIGTLGILMMTWNKFGMYFRGLRSWELQIDSITQKVEVVHDFFGFKSRLDKPFSDVNQINYYIGFPSDKDNPPLFQPRQHFLGCKYLTATIEPPAGRRGLRKTELQFVATQEEIDWLAAEINSFTDLDNVGIIHNIIYADIERAKKAEEEKKSREESYSQAQAYSSRTVDSPKERFDSSITLEKTLTSLRISVPPIARENNKQVVKIALLVGIGILFSPMFYLPDSLALGNIFGTLYGFFVALNFIGWRISLWRSSWLTINVETDSLEIEHELFGFDWIIKKKLSDINSIAFGVGIEETDQSQSERRNQGKQTDLQPSEVETGSKLISIELNTFLPKRLFIDLLNPLSIRRLSPYDFQLMASQTEVDWLVYELDNLVDRNSLNIEIKVENTYQNLNGMSPD
jgi:hypothetical protein